MPFARNLLPACLAILALTAVAAGEQAAADLAEPGWPIALHWGGSDAPKPGTTAKAGLLAWLPGEGRVRALLLVPNNSDSKSVAEHAPLRAMAARRGMAIVYLRQGDHPEIQAILDAVAAKAGVPALAQAPWIVFGKSSRGSFPHELAWRFPQRTIASIDYHAAVPPFPPPAGSTAGDASILHVNANGETEWGGTWFNHARPTLLNYRARTAWLPHVAVARGVGHGDYADGHGSAGWGKPVPAGTVSCLDVWNYLTLFMDKALALRLPAEEGGALRTVDADAGVLIDPFAVEALFDVPRLPLVEKDGSFALNPGEDAPVSGHLALAPPAGFTPAAGVPVVRYESGQSPREWLITDSLKFAMQADPMTDLGPLRTLTPKPGDQITVDGSTLTFQPIPAKYVGPNGGLAMNTGLRPPRFDAKITVFAATVLEFSEARAVKVAAGFTAATRVQLVLAGVPLRHKQVVEVQPGRYPLLLAIRMAAKWDRVEPHLIDASADDQAQAKAMEAEVARAAAAYAQMKAEGKLAPAALVRPAAEVPAAERRRMLWVADREQADAWIALHRIGTTAK